MNKKRVLIVDDVPANIHLLTSLLKSRYLVSATTEGKKAIELANNDLKPDIILLDVYMPKMSGIEVLEKLRSDDYTKDIPIIFVSSSDEDDYKDFTSKENVGFLQKPFTSKDVFNTIDKYVPIYEKPYELDIDEEIENEKQSILVIDDTAENIKVIVEILKDDYKVSVSTNAKNALTLLEDGLKPSLILLDVLMPEVDGFEMCEILKKDERFKSIPIVFLTILENEHDIVKGLQLGAVDYITKPFEPIVLKARIQTHIKLKKYHSQLLENLRKKEELLIKQSKMATMGEMFENITHQWKQPLSVISLTSDSIRILNDNNTLDEQKLYNSLNNIKESSTYLAQTVEGFRDFLKEDIQKQYFDIKDLVEKSLTLLSIKFKNENILIDTDDLESIEVYTYKNDLIQVLMNVLNNAKDALENIKKDKIIKVISKKQNDKLSVEIIDNGGGIEEKNMTKLFSKYFTTKSGDKGTGIGLYMSKILVENHLSGTINVSNKNGGACFEILIPIKSM